MNNLDPLANLNPLRLPEAVGWWPLAPGWWLLAAAAAVAGALLVLRLLRYLRRNAYRRAALRELQELLNRYGAADATAALTGINQLLKRTAMAAFPARDTASLAGAQWIAFLNSQVKGGEQLFVAEHVELAYQKNPPSHAVAAYALAARQWIQRHRPAARQ